MDVNQNISYIIETGPFDMILLPLPKLSIVEIG
jgi:hypothetical protein